MGVYKSELAVEISKELTHDERTKESPIEAIDDNGVITLKGKAESEEVSMAAEEIASKHEGVLSVVNDITVEPIDTTGSPPNFILGNPRASSG